MAKSSSSGPPVLDFGRWRGLARSLPTGTIGCYRVGRRFGGWLQTVPTSFILFSLCHGPVLLGKYATRYQVGNQVIDDRLSHINSQLDIYERKVGTALDSVHQQLLSDTDTIVLPRLRQAQKEHEKELDDKFEACVKKVADDQAASEAKLQARMTEFQDHLLSAAKQTLDTLRHDSFVHAQSAYDTLVALTHKKVDKVYTLFHETTETTKRQMDQFSKDLLATQQATLQEHLNSSTQVVADVQAAQAASALQDLARDNRISQLEATVASLTSAPAARPQPTDSPALLARKASVTASTIVVLGYWGPLRATSPSEDLQFLFDLLTFTCDSGSVSASRWGRNPARPPAPLGIRFTSPATAQVLLDKFLA